MCLIYVFIFTILKGSCSQEFLIVTHDGVSLHSPTGGHKQIALLRDMVKDLDYHYKRGELYLLTYRQILRTSLMGPPTTNLTSLVDPQEEYLLTALAVDWVHDTLYWTSGAVLVLYTSLLDGSNPRVLYRGLYIEQNINKLLIDPYVGLLFWMTNNEVHSSDLVASSVRRNVFPRVASVRNIALDPSSQRVFLLAAGEGPLESWRLVSCDYDGAGLLTFTNTPSVIYGLGGLHHHVYWIPHEEESSVWVGNDDYHYRFSLYATNASHSSNASKPSLLISFSEHVWNLRVYHQDLQEPMLQKSIISEQK